MRPIPADLLWTGGGGVLVKHSDASCLKQFGLGHSGQQVFLYKDPLCVPHPLTAFGPEGGEHDNINLTIHGNLINHIDGGQQVFLYKDALCVQHPLTQCTFSNVCSKPFCLLLS